MSLAIERALRWRELAEPCPSLRRSPKPDGVADAHRSTPTGIGSSAEANASATFGYLTLLLAHLGRPYQRISVDIFNGETLTEEFARMNPMRTTPVLEVEPGRYLPESNAILVYLARGSRYLPEEPFEFAQVIRWLSMSRPTWFR